LSIKDKKNIKLLNYSTSSVVIPVKNGEKIMNGSANGVPFIDFFDWDDIEYIYNRSSALITGLLEPEKEDRKELFEALKRYDFENSILFDEVLEDIIANPTIDNMEKILNIKDIQTIERLRGKMIGYINDGRGLDSRFITVVKTRFDEINHGIRNSKIILKANTNYSGNNSAEIEEMKKQNQMLMQQMEEMKQLLQMQMENRDSLFNFEHENNSDNQTDEIKNKETEPKKSVGRPAKK
jgi:hypothetical protein